MEWIRENWVFIIFLVFFIGMHLFGHGMHGGHGEHSRRHDEHPEKGSSEKKGDDT
jgi:hypothetical protein